MDRVKDAIKNQLPDLISEEQIILSQGNHVVKIPIRSLDEYKIRYNYDKQKQVGQGEGDSQVGDVLGRIPEKTGKGGKGKKAGSEPGEEYFEAQVDLMEVQELLFKELELPNLLPKQKQNLDTTNIQFTDIRKKGLIGNIDKRKTILQAIKRNAMNGEASINPILEDDLRFKTWEEKRQPESQAVIIAMMDNSGSMGVFEKYVARSFFFWMARFLRSKYESVTLEFIAHHTEAKVVNEEQFFKRGESGGTICSSAYAKALEIIDDRYPPQAYNIYPFHFSDGDNLTSDNKKCLELVEALLEKSNMVGYGEINPYQRQSTLMGIYNKIDDPRFRHFIIKQKSDVYGALKHFFQKQAAGAAGA